MQAYPNISELIEAVQHHLNSQLIPVIEEPGLRFRTLVAANVLAIVARELKLAEAQSEQEWQSLTALLNYSGEYPSQVAQGQQAIDELNQLLCQQIEMGVYDTPAGWQQLLAHCRQTAQARLKIANPKFLERLGLEQQIRKQATS